MHQGGRLPLLNGHPQNKKAPPSTFVAASPASPDGGASRGRLGLFASPSGNSMVRLALVIGILGVLALTAGLHWSERRFAARAAARSQQKPPLPANASSGVAGREASPVPGEDSSPLPGKEESPVPGKAASVGAALGDGGASTGAEGAAQAALAPSSASPGGGGGGGEGNQGKEVKEEDEEEEEQGGAQGPDESRPSRCSEKCFEHGTCNEELGECFCTAPWGGPDCSDPAMPACHLSPSYWTPCKDITTCECMQECQKFALPMAGQCVRGTNEDGSKKTNVSEIMSGTRYVVQWNRDFTHLLPINYGHPLNDPNPSPQTDPAECPGSCGGKSACGREHKNCYCSWATAGAMCEQTPSGLRVPCFNTCSERGECVFGTCKCNKGYFGLDCSLYLDKNGKTRILERPPYTWSKNTAWPKGWRTGKLRPKVYVYDLPPYFNTWQGLYSNFLDWAEPIWWMERVHNTPFRTPNPDEADFFFLPLFIRNRDGNRAGVVRLAKEYVKGKYPYFNRKGGSDHFVFTNSDWGACEMGGMWGYSYGEMHPVMDDIFQLTLWGCSKSMHLTDHRPCFRPGRDIVAPPDQDLGVFQFAPGLAPAPPEPPFDKRDILLYFRGYMALDAHKWGKAPYTWSFNVRQEMYERYKGTVNQTGILLETMESGPWDHWHLRQMQRSIFCLGPAGWGWGMRAPQVVIMGCIPVIIQPYTYQPLEGDLLDWNEFGVMLKKEDIPNIEQILRAIPESEIEKKRRALEAVRMRFMWSSTNYNPLQFMTPERQEELAPKLVETDAFASIMLVLQRRLKKQTPSPSKASVFSTSSLVSSPFVCVLCFFMLL